MSTFYSTDVHPFLQDQRPYLESIGYKPKEIQIFSNASSYQTHKKTPSTCSSCGSCVSHNSTSSYSSRSYGSYADVYTSGHSRQHSTPSSVTRYPTASPRESMDIELSLDNAGTRATSLDIIERKFGKEMAQEAERRAGRAVSVEGRKDKTRRFGRIF